MSGRATLRPYVRALEATLLRLLDRPVVLSHRDWDLARRWHDRGIPLGLVIDALEERPGRPPRGLGSVAKDVEEAWRVVTEGAGSRSRPSPRRVGGGARSPDPGFAEAMRAAAATAPNADLAAALERIAGAALDRREVDRALDEAVERHAPAPWKDDARRRAAVDLAGFRGRMPPDRLAEANRRAVSDHLRRRLGLPSSST